MRFSAANQRVFEWRSMEWAFLGVAAGSHGGAFKRPRVSAKQSLNAPDKWWLESKIRLMIFERRKSSLY